MNKRQKEVLGVQLSDEKATLQALEKNYINALADVKRNIKELQSRPLTQSKAYRLNFQKQLEKQLTGIINTLQEKNFTSITDYLNVCYTQGFVGTMYDLQGQGVPFVFPIDQKQVLKAIQKTGDSIKLSNKLGSSTNQLKKEVLSELQRGLAAQSSYEDIARNISIRGSVDMNRAMRIARTEGHRIQNEAKLDSLYAAKEKGADVVKQWDSTFDGKTRPEHAALDGQVRELDEKFTVGSYSAPCPGSFGDPYMDCECRCHLLQRTRRVVKGEKNYQKWNNETGEFIECSGYEDFKEKYLKAADKVDKIPKSGILSVIGCTDFDSFTKYLGDTYGIQVHDSVKLLDFDAVKESMAGVEGVMQEFTQAQVTLESISTSESGVMCATYEGAINFNPEYYTDGEPIVRTLMVQGNTTGLHPKNTGVLETGSHEMGHLLERALIEKVNPDGSVLPLPKVEQWNKCTQAKAVVSDACKAAKKKAEGKGVLNRQLKSDVSRYAKKNDSECLAECVADYAANGEKASILSKEVWKILKERLG